MDPAAASKFCAFFSATGILFTSWVGILLMKQPFFIAGVDNVEVAKGSAFGAAAAFFFTFIVSIVYMIWDEQRRAGRVLGGAYGLPRLPNPFSERGRGGRPVFHDYNPVDTDTPPEFEEGVLS